MRAIDAFDLHIICRLSVQEAADGESLEAQVAQAKNDAAILVETDKDNLVFVEGATTKPLAPPGKKVVKLSSCYVSGGTQWEDGLDLQDILAYAKAGRCRAVLTPNLDRVARNVEVAERFRRELLTSGVRVLYEGRTPYDLADDNQQLLYGLRAQFSAWERGIITRRNFSGHIRAAREGYYIGGNIPFGTRLKPTGVRSKSRRYRVIVDDAEMAIVHQLFERRAAGWSVRQLEAWTRQLGVAPNRHHYRSAGPGVAASLIHRILANDFYVTGKLIFNVRATRWPTERIEQQIELRSPVPLDLFEEVARLRAQRRGSRLRKGAYLLTGLVYHRESGTPFRSSVTASRYYYYRNSAWGKTRRRLYETGRLSRAQVTPQGARQVLFASVHKERLESLVMGELTKLYRDPSLIDRLVELDHESRVANTPAIDDVYLRKQAETDEAEAYLERFLEAIAAGVLTMTDATADKHRQLEARVAVLRAEVARLREQHRRPGRASDRAARLKSLLSRLPEVLKTAFPQQQAIFIRTTVSRVWIDDIGGVTLEIALDQPANH